MVTSAKEKPIGPEYLRHWRLALNGKASESAVWADESLTWEHKKEIVTKNSERRTALADKAESEWNNRVERHRKYIVKMIDESVPLVQKYSKDSVELLAGLELEFGQVVEKQKLDGVELTKYAQDVVQRAQLALVTTSKTAARRLRALPPDSKTGKPYADRDAVAQAVKDGRLDNAIAQQYFGYFDLMRAIGEKERLDAEEKAASAAAQTQTSGGIGGFFKKMLGQSGGAPAAKE